MGQNMASGADLSRGAQIQQWKSDYRMLEAGEIQRAATAAGRRVTDADAQSQADAMLDPQGSLSGDPEDTYSLSPTARLSQAREAFNLAHTELPDQHRKGIVAKAITILGSKNPSSGYNPEALRGIGLEASIRYAYDQLKASSDKGEPFDKKLNKLLQKAIQLADAEQRVVSGANGSQTQPLPGWDDDEGGPGPAPPAGRIQTKPPRAWDEDE